MTVKDIVKTVATLVGREDVVQYLSEQINTNENEELFNAVDLLTRLVNLVISELACSYVPMVKKETVALKNGKIYYKDLQNTPLAVKNVYDSYGNAIAYTVKGEYVETVGTELEYTVLPQNYGLEDVVGYEEKDVPKHVLAYGTAAEYSISRGCFDEAVTWHGKYVDALYDICLPKNRTVKQRSWV